MTAHHAAVPHDNVFRARMTRTAREAEPRDVDAPSGDDEAELGAMAAMLREGARLLEEARTRASLTVSEADEVRALAGAVVAALNPRRARG